MPTGPDFLDNLLAIRQILANGGAQQLAANLDLASGFTFTTTTDANGVTTIHASVGGVPTPDAIGALSPVVNSLCHPSLADDQWSIFSSPWSTATPVRINDQQDNAPYGDSVLLNPYSNAALDQRTFRVCAPPGATSLTFTMNAKLPTAVGSSTVGLAWLDATGVTTLQGGTAVLTANYANYTLTLNGVTPGTEYIIMLTCSRGSFGASTQAQAEVSSVAVTAANATGVFSGGNYVRLHLYPQSYNGNAEDDTSITDRGYRHSAFAPVTFETSASSFVVELWNGVFSTIPNAAGMGVFVNKRYFTTIPGQGTNTTGSLYYTTVDLSSLPPGVKRIDIVSCSNVDNSSPPNGTVGGFIRAVYMPAGIPARHIVETPRRTLVIVGDSISQGHKTTNDNAKCVGTMLRQYFPGRVIFDGAGSRTFFFINTPGGASQQGRQAYAQHLRTAGATDVLWWLGVNDARTGFWSGGATQYGAALGDQFDQIQSELPGVTIHYMPFLINLTETVLDPYRSQGTAQAYARSGFCKVFYAAGLVGATGDYDADNLHMTNQGDDKLLQGLLGYFGLGGVQANTGFMPKSGGYTYSSATLWEGWESPDVALGAVATWSPHFNAIALSQSTGNLQPTMIDALTPGGLRAARFAGGAPYMQTSAQTLGGPCTVVLVFRPQQTTPTNSGNCSLFDGRGAPQVFNLANTTNFDLLMQSTANYHSNFHANPSQWAIVCVTDNGSSSAIYLDQNATTQTATGLVNGAHPTLAGFTLGNTAGGAVGQAMDVAACYVFTGAMSLQEFIYLKEGYIKPQLKL